MVRMCSETIRKLFVMILTIVLRSLNDIYEGLVRGNPDTVILPGLLVLIGTQILRVAILAVIFFTTR
jgi:uncharacterized membrane protein